MAHARNIDGKMVMTYFSDGYGAAPRIMGIRLKDRF